jgi:hypothetical protein
LGPSTPLPAATVTPVPIFQASPAYILGLRSATAFAYDPVGPAKSLVERGAAKYLPPTTWKPKYPKILEHTLRTTAQQRLRKHVTSEKEEVEEEKKEKEEKEGEDYNYEYYD